MLRSPVPVVVGFMAEWCVPCQMAAPALESAERKHAGRIRFGLVDFDRNPGIVERYRVQGLPTILIMRAGQPTDRRVGLMGRAPLQELLSRHLAPG